MKDIEETIYREGLLTEFLKSSKDCSTASSIQLFVKSEGARFTERTASELFHNYVIIP